MVKSLKPFLFLFTGDEFLRRTKIEALIDQLIVPEIRSTNLTHHYQDDLDWDQVLGQATTSSLLGGAQVFWISQIEKLKKADWGPLESFCQKPAGQSFFIFEAEELAQSHALVKLAGTYGKHIHSAESGREGGFEAIRSKLKRFGKKITPDAWQLLEERLGGSLRMMDLAIDQLILYADTELIDETSAQNLTKEFLKYDPFDLTEALAERNTRKAIKIFHFFYDLSQDMTSIVGLIHWQLKRLWQAKKMLNQGSAKEEMMKTLKISPYRFAGFLSQVKQFDLEQLEKLLNQLWRLDRNSKSGTFDEKVALEAFLASVA